MKIRFDDDAISRYNKINWKTHWNKKRSSLVYAHDTTLTIGIEAKRRNKIKDRAWVWKDNSDEEQQKPQFHNSNISKRSMKIRNCPQQ